MEVKFEIKEIDYFLYSQMLGKSIPTEYKNKVDISKFSLVIVTYLGFDNKSHIGQIIVNKKVDKDVIEIFKYLYKCKYKIEKIRLIDEYYGKDELSMADNNTSCFCYRMINNKQKLSYHSLGLAIDINPLYNPYIVGDKVYPRNGKKYVDRSKDDSRFIKKDDLIYNAFKKRGWKWGGNFKKRKDYQHFYKQIKSTNY